MATNNIKYALNALLMDNTVTPDKDDKILSLVTAGTADKQRVISEIMSMNPGLEPETVEAVLNLEQRAMLKLLLTGFRVNNGLYSAVAQFTGVVEGMAWDSERNSVYISLVQGKEMRDAINATTVNIIGEKGATMYVAGGQDTATRAYGFTATAGRNYEANGSKIKLEGSDPSVGLKLTDADGKETPIPMDMVGVNEPKRLVFIIPAGLADGEYTLTITTQYNGGHSLKAPRSVKQTIYLGQAPEGEGGSGSGDGEGQEENPLG